MAEIFVKILVVQDLIKLLHTCRNQNYIVLEINIVLLIVLYFFVMILQLELLLLTKFINIDKILTFFESQT